MVGLVHVGGDTRAAGRVAPRAASCRNACRRMVMCRRVAVAPRGDRSPTGPQRPRQVVGNAQPTRPVLLESWLGVLLVRMCRHRLAPASIVTRFS